MFKIVGHFIENEEGKQSYVDQETLDELYIMGLVDEEECICEDCMSEMIRLDLLAEIDECLEDGDFDEAHILSEIYANLK